MPPVDGLAWRAVGPCSSAACGVVRRRRAAWRPDRSPARCRACRTQGRNELRRQIGTLRFDINALADGLPKAAKKEALAARADFLAAVEKLDYALVKKNGSDAAKALAETKATLDAVIAKLA